MKSAFITFLLLFGSVCWGQATISVPVVGVPKCEGELCKNVGSESDTPSEAALSSSEASPGTSRIRSTSKHANRSLGDYDEPYAVAPFATPVPEPKERLTEFQQFVRSSTGQTLPIYGRSLFHSVPSTFAPVDHIAVPEGYVVGPGDEIFVRAWGQIDVEARVAVDRGGQIFLPKVGTISVAGVRYSQLQSVLKSSIGRLFKNFDVSVSIGQLRSIQVMVVGRAKHPGVYTVSSLSTLVNALFASGGPDVNGSMRHIQLKRGDRVVADLDLYDLLVRGDRSKDAVLAAGDVIFIPPVGAQVAVFGSVNFPAIYEAREGATVSEQLQAAGGIASTASDKRAVLERVSNRSSREVQEFPLDAAALGRTVHDGDVIRVFPISPKFDNAITLRGNAAQPGRYTWRTGMRVRDLIPSREAIITREYWLHQGAAGAVVPEWTPTEDSRERITHLSANDVNWNYAVVERMDEAELSPQLVPFDLGRAIADPNSSDNLPLRPGDTITIFSQHDVAVPSDKRAKFVRIEGEVNAPGIYRVSAGEGVRKLIEKAGGLTPKAYIFAADFRRESTRLEQKQNLEKAVEQMESDLRSRAAQLTANTEDEQRMAQSQLQRDRDALAAMRKLEPAGRIVLNLKPETNDPAAIPDFALEDGDSLLIPPRPATVEVMGSVYNQSAILFSEGREVRHYLAQAGGTTRGSDDARMFVIRADGSVVSRRMSHGIFGGGFDSMKVMPGDTIVVPQKVQGSGVWRSIRDWSQIFTQFALGAAAIKVLGQ